MAEVNVMTLPEKKVRIKLKIPRYTLPKSKRPLLFPGIINEKTTVATTSGVELAAQKYYDDNIRHRSCAHEDNIDDVIEGIRLLKRLLYRVHSPLNPSNPILPDPEGLDALSKTDINIYLPIEPSDLKIVHEDVGYVKLKVKKASKENDTDVERMEYFRTDLSKDGQHVSHHIICQKLTKAFESGLHPKKKKRKQKQMKPVPLIGIEENTTPRASETGDENSATLETVNDDPVLVQITEDKEKELEKTTENEKNEIDGSEQNAEALGLDEGAIEASVTDFGNSDEAKLQMETNTSENTEAKKDDDVEAESLITHEQDGVEDPVHTANDVREEENITSNEMLDDSNEPVPQVVLMETEESETKAKPDKDGQEIRAGTSFSERLEEAFDETKTMTDDTLSFVDSVVLDGPRDFSDLDQLSLTKHEPTGYPVIHFRSLRFHIIPALKLRRMDCDLLVAAPYDNDLHYHSHLHWRKSYLFRERFIFRSVKSADNGNRLKVLDILHTLTKTDTSLSALTFDVIKSVILHDFDNRIDTTPRWQRNDLETGLVNALQTLADMLTMNSVPHFFMKQFNLIKNVPLLQIARLRARVKSMTSSSGILERAFKIQPAVIYDELESEDSELCFHLH